MTPQRAIAGWFTDRGWKPFAFQKEVWKAMAEGQSGLLHATTGAGKTYAVWLGAVLAFTEGPAVEAPAKPVPKNSKKKVAVAQSDKAQVAIKKIATKAERSQPLTVLWITPMRALAADTLRALRAPLDALAPQHAGIARWSAGARTGDTASSERSAQSRRLPTVLVTTPESLALLLARADAEEVLGSVQLLVADEWHELIGNKRGVQLQLAIARLQGWNPALRIWGMSATLGNLQEAMQTLIGSRPARADGSAPSEGVLVQGRVEKSLVIDTLLPEDAARFSWAGHLGLGMLPQVVRELESASTTLVFVNVRSQAELWYKAILDARPDWAGTLAIHHGSLDRGVREWVEAGLKAGSLRAVVCTSSLDLGVDFLPVERVLQIGSPKGVARLLQRAGRSGHAPGRPSRITLVPTHSLELIEAAAARAAVHAGRVEMRASPHQPVDVLVQHLVTVALGGGFTPDALYAEVRRTTAYRDLPADIWQWCLDFVTRGGPSLAAYPDYRRVVPDEAGIWRVPDARLARRHRSNIGTIVSDAAMVVQVQHGARLGTMEESFLSRLKPGDCFIFAGRVLELVKIEQMTAYVKRATKGRPTVPRWAGSRMALTTVLAEFLVQQMALAADHHFNSPELRAVRSLLEVQERWSAIPTPQTLLAETLETRDGWHLFIYPFAGRHAHIGLASLFAWRAAQLEKGTFSIAINDYGLELVSATPRDWAALLPEMLRVEGRAELERVDGSLPTQPPMDSDGVAVAVRNTANALSGEGGALGELGLDADSAANTHIEAAASMSRRAAAAHPASVDAGHLALLQEVLASLNATEMSRRRFREIARVSGLIFQSHPGERRSNRQLQASAQLFFEVFQKYDDANMLLRQADEEVLSQELDIAELLASLRRMQCQQLVLRRLDRPSPFAFPLMIELFREKLTNENLADRIARMLQQLEAAADTPAGRPVASPKPPANARRRTGPRSPKAEPLPPSPELQAQADAVRRTLDFSLTSPEMTQATAARSAVDSNETGKRPRRVRKPSRPLPRL
jgi:ATP-dependent Lhr-like helicase